MSQVPRGGQFRETENGDSPPEARVEHSPVQSPFSDVSRAEPLVVAENLVKRYDGLAAVDGISFEIKPREVVGFLGPNGAGKTTTIRMLAGGSPRTSGRLDVFGMDVTLHPREIKAQLGIVPQDNNYDPDLSVIENLLVYARYYGIPTRTARERSRELLEFAHLTDKANEKVDDLSGGMKRRLILARGLINTPRMLVLDEPTTGLDPQARRLIWERLRELRQRGVTILITTHYMDEAEQICDRLLIMDNGHIIATGSPRGLITEHAGNEVLEVVPEDGDGAQVEAALGECRFQKLGDKFEVFASDCPGALERIRQSVRLNSYSVRRATLEDVFIRLTGRELRD
ncbi:MAG TPA: ABC transporter ATP-binding protein [bacterium]|nr:ABC transporter ATP-binding protein [bacterium]